MISKIAETWTRAERFERKCFWLYRVGLNRTLSHKTKLWLRLETSVRLQTHRTFMLFSSFSRIFIFELWVIATGAESYLRWFVGGFTGDGIGSPTSSFSSTSTFFILTVSEWESSEDDADVLTEIRVEWRGKPISWNEFMLEKPLSSSVWWQVENLFFKLFWGMLVALFVAIFGKIVGSSYSFEFEEFDDEWTDDSSVLRSERWDSRSKPKRRSPRCWKPFVSDVPFACDRIGSWVLRKFWTVLDNRNASLDSFSASMPTSLQDAFDRLSNVAAGISSVNFSGFVSELFDNLFFGVRRLKVWMKKIFNLMRRSRELWLMYHVKSLKAL